MINERLVSLLQRIKPLISPIEYESDFTKERYALLNGDSLFSGNLGLVLFHYNYYKIFHDEQSEERTIFLLQNIMDRIETEKSSLTNYTLSYGLTGLGIVLHQLAADDFISSEQIDTGNMDELIADWAYERIHRNDSEYMHGAFGALMYLSTIKNQILASQYLKPLLEKLMSKVIETSDGGAYFHMFNEFIPEYSKDSINLSLSHGLSGILMILMNLIDRELVGPDIKEVTIKCLKYLENNMADVDFSRNLYCHSDSVISPEIKGRRNTRLAWCYGDLNQVMVFLKAAKTFNSAHYLEISNSIGLTTVKRKDFDQTYVSDSQFCHGTSGLVQIYHHLYKNTSLKEYLTAKEFWLDKTADLLEKELDTAYYTEKDKTGELLEGLAGVSLVLLSVLGEVNNTELKWDSIFLLS